MSNEAHPYHAYTGRRGTYSYWLSKAAQGLDMYSHLQSISKYHPNPSDFPQEKHMVRRKRPLSEAEPIAFYHKQPKFIGPRNRDDIVLPKKMKRTINDGPINQLSNRASMKRKGTNNVNVRVKKTIKVPKRLKKQIKQVLKAKQIRGDYREVRQGVIGTVSRNGAAANPTKTILGMTVQSPMLAIGEAQASSNTQTLWYILPFVAVNAATAGNYVQAASMMYFHPLKVLNAASVLFNNKPITTGWDVETGNITSRASITTGVGATDKKENVKIDIVNSYVTFEVKNMSQRSQTVKFFNIYPKVKVAKETAITSYVNAITEAIVDNGSVITNNTDPVQVALDPLCVPGKVSTWGNNFKYETITSVIKPGETCKHSIQGPKNYTMDFDKLFINNETTEQFIPKGTCQVMIAVQPDMVVLDQTSGWEPGRLHDASAANTAQIWMPLTVEVNEYFKLSCPETAGFINRSALAGGTGQVLNLKRPAYAFYNVNNNNYGEAGVYSGVDEENPAASIAKSGKF